jgi:hypothetical protein
MKKTRRFQDGGVADEDFTADQLKFLGGADRTDPYILARMRSKFPDKPKAKNPEVDTGELRDETGMVSKIKRNTETGDLYSTEMPSVSKEVKKATAKTTPKPTQSKKPVTDMNEMPESLRAPGYKPSSLVKKIDKKNVIKPTPRSPGKTAREELGMNSDMEDKGKRLMEGAGMNFKAGGKVSSASKRADGCAVRGKTRA